MARACTWRTWLWSSRPILRRARAVQAGPQAGVIAVHSVLRVVRGGARSDLSHQRRSQETKVCARGLTPGCFPRLFLGTDALAGGGGLSGSGWRGLGPLLRHAGIVLGLLARAALHELLAVAE